MNFKPSVVSDVSVQSCSVPEIDWPDLTNSQEYVYSQFAQGSVVWAKQQGYPRCALGYEFCCTTRNV